MSEASKHVLAWREQKREDGYQSVTVWIPGRIKELAVKLAFEQHLDLGVVVAEALQAYVQAKGARPSAVLDMRRMEALIDQKIASALEGQHPAPAPPPATPAPLPAGTRVCRNGHAPSPVAKKECPQCVRARQIAARRRKAEARRGELPTT